MSPARRTAALVTLLMGEVVLTAAMRRLGWLGTGHTLRWLACAAIALAPLVVAALVLLRNRFRFSVRGLLAATTMAALFVWLSVTPLLEAYEARRGAQQLIAAGAELRKASWLDQFYRDIGHDPRRPRAEPSAPALPPWLRPLAGDVIQLPPDDSVREIWLDSDMEVLILCKTAARFRGVENIDVTSPVTGQALDRLLAALDECPSLSALMLNGVPLPKDLPPSMHRIRTLFLWVEGPLEGRPLAVERLREAAELPALEVLMISGYLVQGDDLQALAGSASLRRIILRRTGTAASAQRALAESMPTCVIRSD
jgi:hypothetical protein